MKLTVANVLTSATIGRLIGSIFRNRIRNRGLVFDTADQIVSPKVKASLFFGLYESSEIRMIQGYVKGAQTVVDLGASLGFAGCHALKQMSLTGHYVAVEADPALIPSLKKRLDAHAAGRKVTVVNAAITDTDGQAVLARGDGTTRAGIGKEGIVVPSLTLSSLLNEHDIDGWYTLLMDIEGQENAIFETDAAALEKCTGAVVEFHPIQSGGTSLTPDDLRMKMQRLGFRAIQSHGPVSFMERSGTQP
jgi:FkbM family methyltransferase